MCLLDGASVPRDTTKISGLSKERLTLNKTSFSMFRKKLDVEEKFLRPHRYVVFGRRMAPQEDKQCFGASGAYTICKNNIIINIEIMVI
jgi:hypothetical protein